MVTVGISRTVGTVASYKEKVAMLKLKLPICAERGDRAAISRQLAGRWRLVGWGMVA